jgi:hypothetical protein
MPVYGLHTRLLLDVGFVLTCVQVRGAREASSTGVDLFPRQACRRPLMWSTAIFECTCAEVIMGNSHVGIIGYSDSGR